VGYPAQSIGEDELKPVFERFGRVENVRSIVAKNCAFVTFSDRTSAWMCINTLQRSPVTIRGFTFRLGWGKPDNPTLGGGGSGMGGGGSGSVPLSAPSNCLWLGSVNFDLTEDELHGPFSRFGTIENIRLLPAKKCAFITFSNVAEAELALREMQGQMLRGERLKINFGHGGATKKDEETRLAPVPEVGPPSSSDVAAVIEQLASFVHRLGPAFEEKVCVITVCLFVF
jgi:RNA recognition motif-containing protein